MIQARINAIKVPDMVMKNDTAMYIKDNDFTLTQPTNKFEFINDVTDNCFLIKLERLTASFTTGNFHAHYGILGAYGTAHMKIDTVKLSFGLRPVTQTLPDGKKVPAFESCHYDFDSFDTSDLSFDVSGSFWDGFIDMFKGLYEGKIVDAIKGIMKKELTETLPADMNKLIADTDGKAQLLPNETWWFDFDTEAAGIITDTSIFWGARGIIFDSEFNETIPA